MYPDSKTKTYHITTTTLINDTEKQELLEQQPNLFSIFTRPFVNQYMI